MKKLFTLGNVLLVTAVITLLVFTNWYRGPMTPLSAEEQDYFLQQLSLQSGAVVEFLNPEEARQFMATDDGRGFFVVNAFKFNDQAQYGDGNSSTLSGEEAFNQFTSKVIPLWLAKGAHPIFSSSLDRQGYSDWDFVSVVRYRSRRDFFNIQTSDAFLAAVPDRLAAAESNFRVKVSGNQITLPVALLLAIAVLLTGLVISTTRAFKRLSGPKPIPVSA